jgi:hypothetical protein
MPTHSAAASKPIIDLADKHPVGQQRWNIGRINIAPRRHGEGGPLGEPIAIEIEVMRYGHIDAVTISEMNS